MKKFWTVCGLACCAMPVFADGFYMSGDLGSVKWKIDSGSKTDTAFSIAGGYAFELPFRDTLAIELGYRDLGGFSRSEDDVKTTLDLTAMQLSLLANHKINESLSFYGRLGIADMQIDASYQDDFYSESGSLSKDRAVLGVGGRYALDQHLGVYLEYDRYEDFDELGDTGDLTVSALMVGLDYHF
jgi:hypothetical protein